MKEMLWVVAAILIIFVVVLFLPTGTDNRQEVPEQTSPAAVLEETKNPQPALDEEARYQAMKDEFAKLEKGRRDLKRRLSKVKYHLQDIQLPPSQVQQVNEIMLAGYQLLHTPKMLGAFSDIAGISEELAKVDYAYASLNEVDRIMQESRPGEKINTGSRE